MKCSIIHLSSLGSCDRWTKCVVKSNERFSAFAHQTRFTGRGSHAPLCRIEGRQFVPLGVSHGCASYSSTNRTNRVSTKHVVCLLRIIILATMSDLRWHHTNPRTAASLGYAATRDIGHKALCSMSIVRYSCMIMSVVGLNGNVASITHKVHLAIATKKGAVSWWLLRHRLTFSLVTFLHGCPRSQTLQLQNLVHVAEPFHRFQIPQIQD